MVERRRQLGFDLAVVALLLVTAWVLFLRHAGHLALSNDGFTLTYLIDQGRLPYFTWVPIKESGRPFIGVAYRLGHDLFGGNVAVYSRLHLLFVLGAALGTYALTRLVLPDRPHLAAAAAILKLTWPLNHRLLLDSLLPISFAEMLTVLSAVAFVLGAERGRRSTPTRVAAAVVFVPGLIVAAGTYQTLWPLIALLPLLPALALGMRGIRSLDLLVTWYAAFTAGVAISMWNLAAFPLDMVTNASPLRVLGHWVVGLRAVFVDATWRPAVYAATHLSAGYVITAAVLTVTWLALLMSRAAGPGPGARPGPRALGLLFAFSIVLAITPLLPPSLKAPPVYGTHFGYLAVYGWVMIVLLGASFAWTSSRRAVRVAGMLLVAYFVATGTYFWLDKGRERSELGDRKFAATMSILDVLAGATEDTVITVPGRSPRRNARMTTHLRMITDTYATYWIADRPPARTKSGTVQVETWMDLRRTKNDLLQDSSVDAWERWSRQPAPFNGRPKPRAFAASRHVALRWSPAFSRYTIDHGAARIDPGATSRFGRTLYPDAERWRGGSFVRRDVYTVLHHTGPDPTAARHALDWYDPTCGLIVTADDEDERLTITGEPVVVHVAVPETGGPWRVGFTSVGGALVLQTTRTPAPQRVVFPDAAEPAQRQSPELAPGVHVLRLAPPPEAAERGRVELTDFVLDSAGSAR